MSDPLGRPAATGGERPVPVTDPVRVMLVDPDIVSGTELCRAIDMDRELAVVGFCRNPRRAREEADRCQPDLVAVRLRLDEERCSAVLADLAVGSAEPCVIVLGPPGTGTHGSEADPSRDAQVMKSRIRAVAQANFGLSQKVSAATLAHLPQGIRLN